MKKVFLFIALNERILTFIIFRKVEKNIIKNTKRRRGRNT